MISTRFGIVLCFILSVAIVPTVIHTYIGVVEDDKLIVEKVSTNLAGLDSRPTNRQAEWVKDMFGSYDWLERRYTGSNGENVLLFVARSYDLKRLYHYPEIGILRGVGFEKRNIEYMTGMSDIPVHILKSQTGKGLAAYILLYDGQFVNNPIKKQLLSSIGLMFNARKPMTMFFVYDEDAVYNSAISGSRSVAVLFGALNGFLSQKIK